MSSAARHLLQRIHARSLPKRPLRILNVCGGHERSLSMAGLRRVLPDSIELIPGPGCPVCVCPEEDIHQAIQLALHHRELTLAAFGDMLRVPVNSGKKSQRSLAEARAHGADVRAIASPQDAVALAEREPHREVVLFAAGFETTTVPIAAMLAAGAPRNLSVLLSARRTWPAVAMLLGADKINFDALIAPGHVATVMGPEEWRFVVERHKLPAAVAGFTADSLLAAIDSLAQQFIDGHCLLDNCYPELVRPGGNPTARRLLDEVLRVTAANWRGIGEIAASGYTLADDYAAHDARRRYPNYDDPARKRRSQMPPGCDCARVVLGQIYPNQCVLYGRACTPRSPIGPCMVSDEGACRIWWSAGKRPAREHAATADAGLISH